MHIKKIILSIAFVSTLSGCAAVQEVTKFDGNLPKNLCIAEHTKVKEGVLHALQDGFKKHGINTRIIDGTYVAKHGALEPEVNLDDIKTCDGIVFYTARWNWDLALYMSFANIWVTDIEMSKKVAQATYTSRHGLDKFINAKNKVLELVDDMVKPAP